MRAYFFGNMYLSSIQQGIQAAHVTHELFTKYPSITPVSDHLFEWANHHKTMVLLNGGYGDNLRELIHQFDAQENPYPWMFFNEGEDSLDGALTCVGIVLPEKIYETAKALREEIVPVLGGENIIKMEGEWSPEEGVVWELSKWEYELCLELNNYGLAS